MIVSVLMSIYKGDDVLALNASLESIVQYLSYADEFVIVVDGPETDMHVQAVKSVLPDDKLKIVLLPSNLGLGRALNAGLQHCRGDIICRMDSDDICVSSRFSGCVELFRENPNLAVVGSNILEVDEQGREYIRKVPNDFDGVKRFSRRRNPINHVSVCFRKHFVMSVGSYNHCPFHEDYDLWLRLMQSGVELKNIDDIWVRVSAGSGQISRRRGVSYFWHELFFLRKNIKWFGCYAIPYLLVRLPVRFMPANVVTYIYRLLRKR
ncbi:glycosyltransferase [SAR92 clade bacterium H455]|uniref:Glycosyltransferase n=1 Tax=SAR92 clade bacterium H455 TaxID=2974818 RepID=A0ABY5TUW2_9GAMM|nr:glycosyltransferase [SAR92 clade bacterium H455]